MPVFLGQAQRELHLGTQRPEVVAAQGILVPRGRQVAGTTAVRLEPADLAVAE